MDFDDSSCHWVLRVGLGDEAVPSRQPAASGGHQEQVVDSTFKAVSLSLSRAVDRDLGIYDPVETACAAPLDMRVDINFSSLSFFFRKSKKNCHIVQSCYSGWWNLELPQERTLC